MTHATRERLQFLLETLAKERRHLLSTTQRLFAEEVNAAWVNSLDERPDVSERLDAFVARFGRMQDTLGVYPGLNGHPKRSCRSTWMASRSRSTRCDLKRY
jgi:hypothetical protein